MFHQDDVEEVEGGSHVDVVVDEAGFEKRYIHVGEV